MKSQKIEQYRIDKIKSYYSGQVDQNEIQDGLARIEWESGDMYEG